MIIVCPSCGKNFDVDQSLIPDKGRLLKCGSCDQTWFFNKNISEQTKPIIDRIIKQKKILYEDENIGKSVSNVPTISAMGYAVVSSQPGRSANQKRLMAIRSARMAAMRDLAEQIHGLKVEGNTTVIDLMVQNDTFRGIVSGTIRGARTVRINPTGSDTYEVLLEIDKDTLSYLLRQARSVA